MAVATDLGPQAQIVDRWLRDRGVEASYEADFKVAEINMDRSLKNQARLDRPIDEETVNQYATDLAGGDEFPPIVVWKNKRTFVLVSGVHRTLAALAANFETFPAFIVETDNEMAVAVLTYEANTKHGLPTTNEERIVQALYLVDQGGLSQSDAARLLHISPQTVQRAQQNRKTRDRLKLLGFKGAEKLPDFSTYRLGSFRADEVLLKGAELVRDAALGTEAVSQLATKVNGFRSDAEQLEVLDLERKRLQPQITANLGGAVKLPSAIRRIAIASGSAAKLELPSDQDLGMVSPKYRKELAGRARDASVKLAALAVQLEEHK